MKSVQDFFTDASLPFFDLISDAGTGAPFVILLLLVFLMFGTRVGLRAGLYYSIASYFTFVLKWLIAAPRPYFIDPQITAHSLSTGFGMPSGHAAQTSAGLWPAIIASKVKVLTLAMVVFVLLVALARIYLGVHFLLQVMAGLALGTAVFLIGYVLEERVVRWLKACAFPVQVVLVLAPLILFYTLDRAYISALPEDIPLSWQAGYDRAIEARGLQMGLDGDSPEVLARKVEFTLTEPRSIEFYAGFLGWLLVGLLALRHGTYEVHGWRHALANLSIGVLLIGSLFGLFFGILDILALQLALICIAPMTCAFAVPAVTQRWWPMETLAVD